jgi:glycosyltransferase involved in cell wall biosynthesis
LTSEPKALRVALVAEGAIWGGIETHLENLLTAVDWRRQGIEVCAFLLHPGPLEDRLRGRVQVERAHEPSRRGAIAWLRDALARFEPDVVHAHGLTPEFASALLRATGGGWPLVATIHSDPGSRAWRAPERSALASLLLWTVRRLAASRLIAVSDDVRRSLVNLGLSAERVVCIRNGVPMPSASEIEAGRAIRRELGVAPETVVIGMVGRLEPIKGHARFLRALARLGPNGAGIEGWIVGEGPLRRALEEETERLGLRDRVRFLGFRSDVGDVMTALDLGVFASDHEGIPYAALELMTRHVPVVCFAVGGLPEIVRGGESGELVPPYDEAALADALLTLARDPETRRRQGAAAAADVRSRFSLEAMAAATLAVWRAP